MRLTPHALRVLALLYHSAEQHYGLSLSKALHLGNGTLYPILDKLEDAGLLTATWEDIDPHLAGRRPRRFYSLTGEGVRTFERERTSLLVTLQGGVHHA